VKEYWHSIYFLIDAIHTHFQYKNQFFLKEGVNVYEILTMSQNIKIEFKEKDSFKLTKK